MLSVAKRSYPTSNVRSRSQEVPMPEGRRPKELPHIRGEGQWLRVPGCNGVGTAQRSYPVFEIRVTAERSYPASEVRGSDERSHPASKVGAAARRSNPRPRPGVAARSTKPMSKEQWLRGPRRA